jgi:hypothetical protein
MVGLIGTGCFCGVLNSLFRAGLVVLDVLAEGLFKLVAVVVAAEVAVLVGRFGAGAGAGAAIIILIRFSKFIIYVIN